MSAAIGRIDDTDDPPGPSDDSNSAVEKAQTLYQACIAAGDNKAGKEFTIADLGKLNISTDDVELRDLCQSLLDLQLFVPYSKRGVTIYRTRSAAVATKLSKLSGDVILIYNNVAGTARTGIWKKTLAEKTNLHDLTVLKGIKELMAKKLVKEFRSSKNATKRMYILYELEPSEESTGGAFYNEGELDEGYVGVIGNLIVRAVEELSWSETKSQQGKLKKTKYLASVLFPEHYYQIPLNEEGNVLVNHPESFADYPTAAKIKELVEETEVLKDPLTDEATLRVINMLVYDGKLYEVHPGKYKTTRRLTTDPQPPMENNLNPGLHPINFDDDGFGPGTGLSGIPCDRCPVAKDCRPGGIVSPEKCQYMERWLEDMDF